MSELFVRLEVGWLDHPDLIILGPAARGVHVIVLALAKRMETDGWVDVVHVYREGGTEEVVGQLIDAGLLEVAEGGDKVRPSGWHDRNPSQGAIDANRRAKKRGGAIGNHRRWDHPGSFGECPICHPALHGKTEPATNPQVVAPCDRIGIARGSHSDPQSTETETETETPPPASQDYSQPPSPKPVEPVVVDQQMVRRCAAAISKTLAAGASDPAAYAATVARRMLTGDDPTDRDEITRRLTAGETVETIVATWLPADPLTGTRPGGYVAPPAAGPTLTPWTTPAYDDTPLDPAEVAAAAAAARTALPKHRATA